MKNWEVEGNSETHSLRGKRARSKRTISTTKRRTLSIKNVPKIPEEEGEGILEIPTQIENELAQVKTQRRRGIFDVKSGGSVQILER